jgi:uncharacterized protein YejL (UPF0352 family)
MDSNNQLDLSFLDSFKISVETLEELERVSSSRELRILVFGNLRNVFQSSSPLTQEQAASKYYEAKALMGLLNPIRK